MDNECSRIEHTSLDLKPLLSRVIIRKKETPERVGNIYVPTTSREMEPTEGEVVAVGPDVTRVKPGDNVYFGRYSGFVFERFGRRYVFCNEEDLLAVIESKDFLEPAWEVKSG